MKNIKLRQHIESIACGLIVLMSIIVTPIGVEAQNVSTKVFFRQSHSQLDTAFRDNGSRLARLIATVDSLQSADSTIRLKAVRVVGAASPEGSVRINNELSERRAESIIAYVARRLPEIDSLPVSNEWLGRDWSGLQLMVERSIALPDSATVVSVIGEVIASDEADGASGNAGLARLKRLDGGRAYRYMYRNLFPDLRYSQIFIDYDRRREAEVSVPAPVLPSIDTVDVTEQEIVVNETPLSEDVKRCSPFYMDLRTNLLYDALALPNIGVEFYAGRGWSVGANAMYGWWSKDSRHRYWRAYGGEVNVRRWLGGRAAEKPLSGHHLGLYAGAVTYDFEFGHTGYMGGKPGGTLLDRANFYGGLEYGYSLAVGRRLNIDFTIGVGYLGGKYVKYTPCPEGGYLWQSTHRLGWFGPTKAEISLVWLIGCGNRNEK